MSNGGAGILGLGFPSQRHRLLSSLTHDRGAHLASISFVGQAAVISEVRSREWECVCILSLTLFLCDIQFGNTAGTDNFIRQFVNYGPIVPRLILAGVLDQPLFTVRDYMRPCTCMQPQLTMVEDHAPA